VVRKFVNPEEELNRQLTTAADKQKEVGAVLGRETHGKGGLKLKKHQQKKKGTKTKNLERSR